MSDYTETNNNNNTTNNVTEILNIPTLNKVFLSGRICKEPESRDTTNGKCVSFRLAHNISISKAKKSTIFINVTCWEKLAETVFKNMHVGSPIIVTGRLCISNWTDKEGKDRSDLFITADNISFLRKNDVFSDIG